LYAVGDQTPPCRAPCFSIVGLIITGLKIEAKEKKQPIIIALTDAQKAFDIVWHAGLMREMNKIGMSDDNWLLFQQWYKPFYRRLCISLILFWFLDK
jgi:hypothetical protein